MKTIGLCLSLLVWPSIAASSVPQEPPEAASARRLFLEIETAARLPSAEQVGRVTRVYRDVCRQLNAMFVAHTVFGSPQAGKADESPAQLAGRIEAAGGWPMVAEAGRRRCREFMTAHRAAIEVLAREDLRGASRRDQVWALRVIGDVHAAALFDDVVAALRDPDPIYAAQALRDLDDRRAIPPLIRRFPDEPTRFFEPLRSLQRNRPPHALLLPLLQSTAATVRWQAAYALVESRDPVLVPLVPALVADPSPEVRRQAGYIALSFDDAGYRRAQPSMLPLLSDADIGVRADVAVAMTSRMDRTSAPTLLGLVSKEDTLEPWRQSNVVQAIQTLTGTYFGLTPGTPSPPQVRERALKDFARWIEAHPADRR